MTCGYVYRNAMPDREDADYVHVTPDALRFFSLERR
jgi:adenylate cyclase